MKVVAVGLWLTIVALGAAYAAAIFGPSGAHDEAHAEAAPLQHEKTRAMNVPVISEGILQGFIAMQFVFTIDAKILKSLAVPPEIYLLDEAFSRVYMDQSIDFRHLEKYDVTALTKHLVEATNARLGAPMIKDVMIDGFSYIPKDVEKDQN